MNSMNQSNQYQGIWRGNDRHFFTIVHSLFLITLLLLGSNVDAAQTCKTATIAASTPTSQFTVNNNGTVTDNKTGLMWKRCPEGLSGTACKTGTLTTFNFPGYWQDALNAAKTLNTSGGFAGYTDWRVPNQKELLSIVETQCFSPSMNLAVFPLVTHITNYYSATPDVSGGLMTVNFSTGEGQSINRSNPGSVRLVRGGQGG